MYYSLDWLNFSYQSERPIFVPVFFSFAFSIIFCVFYFFIYHSVLLRNLRKQKKEIRRLKDSVATEREKHGSMEERNSELQKIVERVQNGVDGQADLESQEHLEGETEKSAQ